MTTDENKTLDNNRSTAYLYFRGATQAHDTQPHELCFRLGWWVVVLAAPCTHCCSQIARERVLPEALAPPRALNVSLKVSNSFVCFIFLQTQRENLHGSGVTTLPTFSHFYLLILSSEDITYRLGNIAAAVGEKETNITTTNKQQSYQTWGIKNGEENSITETPQRGNLWANSPCWVN